MSKIPSRMVPIALVVLLVLVGFWTTTLGDGTDTGPTASYPSGSDWAVAATENDRFSELPSITVDELPEEGLDTLALIAAGGPFPFERDGVTFQNREGILPDRSRGHYQEFTVITPGSDDRGARRIVAGDDGERYYTADHYDSFSEIIEPEESDR